MNRENIVVIDFGGAGAQLAARMIRNAKVYSRVLPHDAPVELIRSLSPSGIVCVGGVMDADAPDSPRFNKDIFALCLPVLAMGYGARALALACEGRPGGWTFRGDLKRMQLPDNELFEGVSGMRRFERADRIGVPKGFSVLSAIEGVVIAMTSDELRCAAVQFTPEVNDIESQRLLANFALNVCKCAPNWTMRVFIDEAVEMIRARVGSARAVLHVTGGIDTSVCAALAHKALGARANCVMVETGLLREGEADTIKGMLEGAGISIRQIDAAEQFIGRLAGLSDAGAKRRAVREEFDRVVLNEVGDSPGYLIKGTIITDRRITADAREGLPGFEGMFAGVLEPLANLFKDEVRQMGGHLGLPDEIIWRQPFPGQGYALRCMGEVTRDKLHTLRMADRIFKDELEEAGLTKQLRQYFAVLAEHGGSRDRYMIALRAVQAGDACARLPYDLLERVVERITGELNRVSRVVYDLTASPPAGIEWE